MRVKLDPGAFMPERAHPDDAGLDLRAREDATIYPHDCAVFDTGVHLEIPRGMYGKVESKSGLNVKHGIVSCGGVIDAGYTGSIAVKLYNLGNRIYRVYAGDKIAQLVIMACAAPPLELVDELDETERGAGAFGSTGR